VSAFLAARGIAVPATALVRAGDPVKAANGITVVRFDEYIGRLRAYGIYAKASFNAHGELVHLIENLAPVTGASVGAPRANEAQALSAALKHLYGGAVSAPSQVGQKGNTTAFAKTAFFHEGPTVTRVVFVASDGTIRRGFLVETWRERGNALHHSLVGPDGAVLFTEQRTNNDAYNVFLKSPSTTPQQVVNGPGSGNLQSPNGWLFSGTQLSTNISGNNAHAYLDVDHNDHADKGGTPISNGEFLASADLSVQPSTTENREVAVQNLFYLNNVLHDVLYTHGFTETAGNFQQNNFARGGIGTDAVNAEAQDGGGFDNADFATPPDGRPPRMQMFLWSPAGPDFLVDVNSPISTSYGAAGATFGPAPTTTGLTGDVVVAVDAGGTSTTDACEPIQTDLTGKIGLVDRGTCNFTLKVANAQAAGAIAVIVANNRGGTTVDVMGAGEGDKLFRKIDIPSVMISQNDGAALKALSAPNVTIRDFVNPLPMLDGTLDSDVVYHEYGHGLTWRMIGGMSGPLAGAIGEGASDGVAMLINGDDKISEYAGASPNGVRRFPYAGYPNTYSDVTGDEVHNDGEVYAAIVWRLIELFDQNGIPRSTLFDYFVDGMNFTSSTPAWEDMRDGMLESVANHGGQHTCLVWQAFAQFGVGVGASGTVGKKDVVTVHESFVLPSECQ